MYSGTFKMELQHSLQMSLVLPFVAVGDVSHGGGDISEWIHTYISGYSIEGGEGSGLGLHYQVMLQWKHSELVTHVLSYRAG